MKSKVVTVFVFVFLIGVGVYVLRPRHQESRSTSVPPDSVMTPGGSTNSLSPDQDRSTVLLVHDSPASSSDPARNARSNVIPEKGSVWFREWPSSSVNRMLSVPPIVVPLQVASNEIGRTGMSTFINVLTNDLQQVEALLRKGDFTVKEWNLSKKAIINDPSAPVDWNIYFDGPDATVSGIKKDVFTDRTRRESIRSEGYNITFHPGGHLVDSFSRNDGSEGLRCFTNGILYQYGRRIGDVNRYSIRWDQAGNVVAEKMEGPSPQVMSAHKKLIEKYKNDPNKAEAVHHLQEELNRMQSNR